MKQNNCIIVICASLLVSCNIGKDNTSLPQAKPSEVKTAGAMTNVMRERNFQGIIDLDTIEDREGLYGLGPAEYLQGELLLLDGRSYISRVNSDSTMVVEETFNAKAPFFVYTNESRWKASLLPDSVVTLKELGFFIDRKTTKLKRPFVFKLTGIVDEAEIHVQNLSEGTKISSPTEPHQSQQNFKIKNKKVSIVGFFWKEHQGVFTEQDSFLHMHLITEDKTTMGHLDQATFNTMKLFLPHASEGGPSFEL